MWCKYFLTKEFRTCKRSTFCHFQKIMIMIKVKDLNENEKSFKEKLYGILQLQFNLIITCLMNITPGLESNTFKSIQIHYNYFQ